MLKKEFCAENFTFIPEAIELGADRIELCDRLDVGGTTPTEEILVETINYAHLRGVEVMCMIRPRGGDFVYTDSEKEQMLAEARQAVTNKADGVVFGCLTLDGDLDKEFAGKLLTAAGDKQTVFHMAFDYIPEEKQEQALEWLINNNVTRVLTRGARTGSALENYHSINALIEKAKRRIEILPGGGITHENLNDVAEVIRAGQFHGTHIIPINSYKK